VPLTVLLVEDERDIAGLVRYHVEKAGMRFVHAADGATALRLAHAERPDIVILDLMLPGLDGLEVCRQLRRDAQTRRVPIIMLTARGEEVDRVVGLELGADDYVVKPFSPRELVARIRAVLRRGTESAELVPPTLEAGPVRMDVERHVVTVRGAEVALPLKEFELLEVLLRNAGRVLTRGQLIDRVWGSDYVGDTKTLDVHVKRLRAKLEENPGQPVHLLTVRGLGYKLEP
jgi:two-component system response regulator RegX3